MHTYQYRHKPTAYLVEPADGLARGGVDGGGIKVERAVLGLAEELAGAVPCFVGISVVWVVVGACVRDGSVRSVICFLG